MIDDILKKARDGESLCRDELVSLLRLPPDSPESFRVMGESRRLSRELSHGDAEVHAQFAVNLAPCPCDCLFCSFATRNGVFQEEKHLTVEESVAAALQLERNGASAVFIMSTADYPFGRFLEISQEVHRALRPETTMIANVGDQSAEGARRLVDAGFRGVYHAIRLREGVDTRLSPDNRKASIRRFQEAGLVVGTCVEPVGPEHSEEEIADLILFASSFEPAYSGAGRRISIPGTALAERGMISELRMSQIVAVTRLGTSRSVIGNCTHEPCVIGAAAGANLFWAEIGANPRDTRERTEEGRGDTIEACRTKFKEAQWGIHHGPSRYYDKVSGSKRLVCSRR